MEKKIITNPATTLILPPEYQKESVETPVVRKKKNAPSKIALESMDICRNAEKGDVLEFPNKRKYLVGQDGCYRKFEEDKWPSNKKSSPTP
jgi:hypothetical protein